MRLASCAIALASLVAAREASALCQRPADAGGYNGYDYAPAQVKSFDGAKVRVWYVTTGQHAVNTATTRMDMVPDNVATAAKVGDDAFARYAQMGFTAPLSDGTCGGDDRFDIYLMHFNAADGDAASETCTTMGKAKKCNAFALVEAQMEKIYGSFDLGARVVITHEIFHGVQDAYDAGLDRFWAEGGAQWAAKTLDPTTKDLEGFLPDFFGNPTRSIDIVSGGVTSGYIYGAAIFPVFLTQHVGADTVRLALEQEGTLGAPSMGAIDAALQGLGTSLSAEFPTFAAWNVGTGKRAGTGGYKDAASYPMISSAAITPFPDAGTATGIASGFSVFYYSYDFGADPQQLSIEADPARVGARVVPLVNGKASLDKLAPLPATVTGPGVLVVAGVSTKKTDAPFTVKVGAPTTSDAGATGGDGGAATTKSGGCAISGASDPSAWLGALALLGARRRRRAR